MIDALRVCYEVYEPYFIDQLKTLEVGDRYDFDGFHVYRIEGKRFQYVFAIRYYEDGEAMNFGELKFGMYSGSPEQSNEPMKVWIWVDNWVLYDREAIHYLDYVADSFGVRFHNITALDLCIDLPWDIPRRLRRLLKRKDATTILNGKKIKDRDADRSEIMYIMSGSLNTPNRYQTVSIKQRNAIKDKAKGITLLAYDKIAEIMNSSGKDYIRDTYGNPNKLYRLEVHMNNAEIREYWSCYGREVDECLIFDQDLLTIMFVEVLNSIVRFDTPEGRIDWETLLAKHITTTPVSDYLKAAKNSLKETYA